MYGTTVLFIACDSFWTKPHCPTLATSIPFILSCSHHAITIPSILPYEFKAMLFSKHAHTVRKHIHHTHIAAVQSSTTLCYTIQYRNTTLLRTFYNSIILRDAPPTHPEAARLDDSTRRSRRTRRS